MTTQRCIALASLLLLTPSLVAAQSSGACEALAKDLTITSFRAIPPSNCDIGAGCLAVDWNIVDKQMIAETLALFRFTEKTPLRVHTSNVNYLLYTVTWSKNVERQEQAFESVSKLFEKVFPVLSLFGGAGALPDPRVQPDETLSKWVTPLEYAHLCLSETTSALTDLVIDKSGTAKRERLYRAAQILEQALPRLAAKRLEYIEERRKPGAKRTWEGSLNEYWQVAERHADLEQRVSEFLPLAKASTEGVLTVLGSEKRNSIVIITAKASKRSGEAVGQAITARYFVGWSKPVSYHVGYGYGRLRDFDFKQVRALSGQDVFAATKPEDDPNAAASGAESSAVEPVAFMTYEFTTKGANDRYGIGFTLGTGLRNPGESVYYGGTVRIFSRLQVTGGWVSAMATRGATPLADTITSATLGTARAVFAELEDKVATRPFVSISFKVY